MNLKYNNSGFTLIELIIGMAISSIVLLSITNFAITYYENNQMIQRMNTEYSTISQGLKSLQKIVFENAEYLTINPQILDGGSCIGNITDTLSGECYSKFGFVSFNDFDIEKNFSIELRKCSVGSHSGKQLIYTNDSHTIPIFQECIYSTKDFEIKHLVEFPNIDMKEKIIRYSILTENGVYRQAFFVGN